MTTCEKIIETARSLGIEAKVWEKAGRLRIYAKTDRKDMAVYLECDGTSDAVDGAAFRVFCNTQQHPNWIRAQVAEYKERFVGLFHAYVVCRYADTGAAPNGYGPDINEMIDEARAFVTARLREIEAAQEA